MYFSAILILFFLLCFSTILGELRLRKVERSKQKMVQSFSEKSLWAATLGHEIRNPLACVLSALQLLNKTPLNTDQQQLLHTANQSSHTLLSLLDTILEQEKHQTAANITRPVMHFSLRELIQPLLETISYTAQQKGLLLIAHTDPDVPDDLQGDSDKVRQILLNLLSNAIKFTDSGIIKLHIHIETNKNGSTHISFCVIDSGRGIPSTELDKIFEPYHRAHNTRISVRGTGLGLSISRSLAQTLGGDITASSVEDCGSIFTFWLPQEAPKHNREA